MALHHPTVAGLTLTWREFRALRSDGQRAEGEPIAFGIWVVADPDVLVDRVAREASQHAGDGHDGRSHADQSHADGMPYFGLVWPAAESLVAKLLTGPRLDGMHVLDLGCGLGACGFAAARQGARVCFFDREPRALDIVKLSASAPEWRAATLDCVVGDWRTPPPIGLFDLILGADVLYDRHTIPALAAFLARHLRPDAEGWLADPGRVHAEAFPAVALDAGLELAGTERLPTREDRPTVRLLRLRRPRLRQPPAR